MLLRCPGLNPGTALLAAMAGFLLWMITQGVRAGRQAEAARNRA
jgi:hypothetical protein